MKILMSLMIGAVGGALSTLFVLSRLSDKLGLEKSNTENYFAEKNRLLKEEYNFDECEGCEGPVWINHSPKCGNYPDSPLCDNPRHNKKED